MRTGEQKIPLFATIGGTFVPDWPNLSICSLDEEHPRSRLGADPIFRSACCAGYCRDNGATGRSRRGKEEARGRGRREGDAQANFHRKPYRPRTSFSDVLEKYDRHSTASSKIYARRCAVFSAVLELALAELSEKRNTREVDCGAGVSFLLVASSAVFEICEREGKTTRVGSVTPLQHK